MQSNQFPKTAKPQEFKPGHYRRVKVWKVHSTHGEFCMYAVSAATVREEFARLKPTATILNIQRNS